jgi:hypothetical protein
VEFGPAAGAGAGTRAGATATPASIRAAAVARQALRHLAIGPPAADHRMSGASFPGQGIVPGPEHELVRLRRHGPRLLHGHRQLDGAPVSCTSQTSLAAFWVGIDGCSSSSVEQDGTLAECYGGAAYYYTWWEMYPANAIQVVGQTLRAGDSITALGGPQRHQLYAEGDRFQLLGGQF